MSELEDAMDGLDLDDLPIDDETQPEWWDFDNPAEMINAVAGDIQFIIESALDARGEALLALPASDEAMPVLEALAEKQIKWKYVTIIPTHDYLVPVDANLSSENDVEYDCVNAERILAKMEDAGSKVNIVVLDACRNNPFERSWTRSTQGKGLAFMNAPSGSLIAYATSPGTTASDGSGQNGLYTSALLQHLSTPDITILEMFQQVRSTVMEKSGDIQVPWESTSLKGNFYFVK
ncbi:MAG: caspase family protein [Proteobacteria bacterium]|nr:caspase family protein [Pseudomonadota bacterium]